MHQTPFPIIQVVGYKNSGKTTLMEKLITYFSDRNMRVGSLKRHGHGGDPSIVKGTDSYKHMQAGSLINAVQGETRLQVSINNQTSLALYDLLKIYSFQGIDLLLIEGYKQANFPKIVLIKEKADLELLESVSNIIAIGLWDFNLAELIPSYDTFSLLNIDKSLPQLMEYIKVNVDYCS